MDVDGSHLCRVHGCCYVITPNGPYLKFWCFLVGVAATRPRTIVSLYIRFIHLATSLLEMCSQQGPPIAPMSQISELPIKGFNIQQAPVRCQAGVDPRWTQ